MKFVEIYVQTPYNLRRCGDCCCGESSLDQQTTDFVSTYGAQ